MYDLQDRADDLIVDQLMYGCPGSWVSQLEPLRDVRRVREREEERERGRERKRA